MRQQAVVVFSQMLQEYLILYGKLMHIERTVWLRIRMQLVPLCPHYPFPPVLHIPRSASPDIARSDPARGEAADACAPPHRAGWSFGLKSFSLAKESPVPQLMTPTTGK